jgi:putative membrane protein
LPGVDIADFWTAFVVAVVLGVVNAILRPLLLILTLPINVLTLGLFTFVLNALLVLVVSNLVPGFEVNGFWAAIAFGLVQSLISSVLHRAVRT